MDDLENSAENLRRALDELADTGSLSNDSLNRLNRTQSTLSRTTENLIKGTTKVVGEMYDYGKQVQKNRESVQSLNPAIDGVTGAFKLLGPVAGALGDALGGVAKVATELADENLRAYLAATNAGLASADAIDGLRESATAAQINVERFAAMLAKDSQQLAFAFGSAASGAEAYSAVATELKNTGLRQSFFNLGLSVDQQADLTNDFMEQQALLGRTQDRDYKRLSKSAADYIYELDALARITGRSREEISAEISSRNDNLRYRALMLDNEKKFGETRAANIKSETDKFLATLQSIDPSIVGAAIDSMRGFGPEAGKLALISSDLVTAMRELSSGQITAQEAMSRFTAAGQNMEAKLTETAASAGGQLGVMNDAALSAMKLSAGGVQKDIDASSNTTKTLAENAKGTIESLGQLQESMLKNASVFQAFDDKLSEITSGPLASFGSALSDLTTWVGEVTGVVPETPAPEAGRATGGYMKPDTTYRVGEFGPELVHTDGPSSVTATSDLRSLQSQMQQISNRITPMQAAQQAMAPTDLAKIIDLSSQRTEGRSIKESMQTLVNSFETPVADLSKAINDLRTGLQNTANLSTPAEFNQVVASAPVTPELSGPVTNYTSSISELGSMLTSELKKVKQVSTETTTVASEANTQHLALLEAQIDKLDQVITAMNKGTSVSKQILRSSTA